MQSFAHCVCEREREGHSAASCVCVLACVREIERGEGHSAASCVCVCVCSRVLKCVSIIFIVLTFHFSYFFLFVSRFG